MCMARYGMFAAGTLGSHKSEEPEDIVEHAGTPKMDSTATAQHVMLVHIDWLPCVSSCKIMLASRGQHAQKGMLQQ